MRKIKFNNGITLIALVVTVIVLLILAGISISMLTGQNGILNRAGEAKDETERSQQEELEKLAGMEALTNINGYEYEDKKTNKKVNIPAGYIVSTKEGENSLEDGLVIKDASGNEFVWVEVPRASVHDEDTNTGYAGYEAYKVDGSLTDTTIIEAGLKKYTEAYKSSSYSGWTDEWYAWDTTNEKLITESLEATEEQKLLSNGCGLTLEEYKRNKEKMLKSIYDNQGFWISRYEIGDEMGTKDNYTIRTQQDVNNKVEPHQTPVSKQNQVPYIYVTCSQAQGLASKMAQGNTVTSSLLFGIQWDLVCKYLEVKLGSNVTVDEKNIINEDSSTWGNYADSEIKLNRGKYLTCENHSLGNVWFDYNNKTTGYVEGEINKKVKSKNILLTTGTSDDAKKQNIYDLAGNLREWTLERATAVTSKTCVFRSGDYGSNGAVNPVSCRFRISIIGGSYKYVGCRATLY